MTSEHPNLQVFTGRSVGNAEVEARFPFGYEVDSGTLGFVGDDASSYGGSAEFTLLWTAPSVGMGQHELNVGGN